MTFRKDWYEQLEAVAGRIAANQEDGALEDRRFLFNALMLVLQQFAGDDPAGETFRKLEALKKRQSREGRPSNPGVKWPRRY